MTVNSTTAPAEPSRNSAGEPPPSPRHHEAVDAVTAQAVRERLLARDHVVLQRSEVKQPARDFMTLAHVGRMLSQCRDRSVAGNLWKIRLGANRSGYRRRNMGRVCRILAAKAAPL